MSESESSSEMKTIAVIGAGPIGIEMHVALKQAGYQVLHLERGNIGATISWFPEDMTFFSSNDRIALCNVPIQNTNQNKTTKEEFLAYLRSLCQMFDLEINTYEEVEGIQRDDTGGFQLLTRTLAEEKQYHADAVVFCTGDMHYPNQLDLPGEDLPNVSHYFHEPHRYFGKKLLVVGGKNSAAEAALRCWHAGAQVAISYRKPELSDHVKYWLKPELMGRFKRGEMAFFPNTVPVAFEPNAVCLEDVNTGEQQWIAMDFTLLLVGYQADNSLMDMAGVELSETQRPTFNPHTMQTNVDGIYLAGTATAGSQTSYKVFIETSHVHVDRIIAHLEGEQEPEDARPKDMIEN